MLVLSAKLVHRENCQMCKPSYADAPASQTIRTSTIKLKHKQSTPVSEHQTFRFRKCHILRKLLVGMGSLNNAYCSEGLACLLADWKVREQRSEQA